MIHFFSCCPPEDIVLRLHQMEKEEGYNKEWGSTWADQVLIGQLPQK